MYTGLGAQEKIGIVTAGYRKYPADRNRIPSHHDDPTGTFREIPEKT